MISDGRHYILLSPALLYARPWLRDLPFHGFWSSRALVDVTPKRWIRYWKGVESLITQNFTVNYALHPSPRHKRAQAVLPCFAVAQGLLLPTQTINLTTKENLFRTKKEVQIRPMLLGGLIFVRNSRYF